MRQLKLLLIEGEAKVREEMGCALRARFGDHSVRACETLAEALQGGVDHFDMVLTEWRLPDEAGAAILERLRKAGAKPIIVVTEANVGAVAAEAVLCGAIDYVVRSSEYLTTLPLVVEKNLAVDKLRREHEALHRQLQRQNETLEQLLRTLETAAATDPLTGLYNRRHFARVLEQMYATAKRVGTNLVCVMMDMDSFKQLNDTKGHQAGDRALVIAAKVISETLRKMDAAARYGGDEFVLLLPQATADEAARVAERIREGYVREMVEAGFTDVVTSMSFGVASVHEDHPASADGLVAMADGALYRNKRRGKEMVIPAVVLEGMLIAG